MDGSLGAWVDLARSIVYFCSKGRQHSQQEFIIVCVFAIASHHLL